MNDSNKILTTTTQLIDPNKLKSIDTIITQYGQIKNLTNQKLELTSDNGNFYFEIEKI